MGVAGPGVIKTEPQPTFFFIFYRIVLEESLLSVVCIIVDSYYTRQRRPTKRGPVTSTPTYSNLGIIGQTAVQGQGPNSAPIIAPSLQNEE